LTKWDRRDQILAQALLTYEGSIGDHGLPTWIAQDPHRKLMIDELTDEASALLENAQKDAQPAPGLRFRVIDGGLLDD